MFETFLSFLAQMKPDFRRIARATQNEFTPEDLQNDALVMAQEIGDRRGKPIDFSDPEDRDLVMSALYVERVQRGDWKMRRSMRFEEESDDEDGNFRLAERLPAAESSDPLRWLVLKEIYADSEALFEASYSQASAYVMAFDNLGNSRQKVCDYLVVSGDVLARRVSRAANIVQIQPSVFDHIERIPPDFLPMPGKSYVVICEDDREAGQLAWKFEN